MENGVTVQDTEKKKEFKLNLRVNKFYLLQAAIFPPDVKKGRSCERMGLWFISVDGLAKPYETKDENGETVCIETGQLQCASVGSPPIVLNKWIDEPAPYVKELLKERVLTPVYLLIYGRGTGTRIEGVLSAEQVEAYKTILGGGAGQREN